MCCAKIHTVLLHSQLFVSYSEYVIYIKKYLFNLLVSLMFYDFLGSDPDPEPYPVNLTGSGSDQKGLIKPDPDPQHCASV